MVERFAGGTDEGCSSKDLPIANPIDSTFLQEAEELRRCTERLGGLVEQACAQLAHNRLPPLEEREEVEEACHDDFGRTSSDMDFQPLPPPGLTLEEKVARGCESYRLSLLEVEGEFNDNRVEHEKLTPDNSHGEDEQEGCIDDSHHFPLPESNFEDQDTSEEGKENPFYDLAWHLALQTVLEDMKEKEKEEVEEGEDLECSQGDEIEEEGREVEFEVKVASDAQDEDEVGVDEASTSYEGYESFPPDLDALLEKDPFAALCQAKAKPSTIPLGG
ncbi:unnamed protein product [Linum trigynum]|uniref:Uncharacterized protein n=1 Tax=Linum trigynum TaxID=586398 RepID=A0AAV2DBS6_9ROSI